MNLLILTQKVNYNDTDLGFFHKWIIEFSKHYEKVTVVCLEKGDYDLPNNVKVLSLGKEKKLGRIRYLINFYKYIIKERNDYDIVFVHMNKEYIVWGGFIWKMLKKKISLWYVHKKVGLSLRIAEKFADKIFAATEKSFRLPTNKLEIVGHGIDIDKFMITDAERNNRNDDIFEIITVGRISPVKDYETLIRAVEILAKNGMRLKVKIIGEPGRKEQEEYFQNLKEIVKNKNLDKDIKFLGAIPHNKLKKYYLADLFAHMSGTGSLDKAILEAMVSGILVLSCNDASREVLKDFKNDLIFKKGDYKELAQKIKKIKEWNNEKKKNVSYELQKIVMENHNLENLIKKIVELCK